MALLNGCCCVSTASKPQVVPYQGCFLPRKPLRRGAGRLPALNLRRSDWSAAVHRLSSVRVNASEDGPTQYVGAVEVDVQEKPPESFSDSFSSPAATSDELPPPPPPPPSDGPSLELLESFDLKLDSQDTLSIALYGSGALVVLWFTSTIVRAIDSIPLFPKLLELVGLGYSAWFTWNYLIFKDSRKELFGKISELKDEILGLDE